MILINENIKNSIKKFREIHHKKRFGEVKSAMNKYENPSKMFNGLIADAARARTARASSSTTRPRPASGWTPTHMITG